MDASLDRKLLVLDLNGLLCDSFRFGDCRRRPRDRAPNGTAGRKVLYARPCCPEFLKFCFDNFDVGVWSSAQKHNVDRMLDLLFGDLKHKLVFVWYQHDCTDTGNKVPGNLAKPLFLKELSKLWNAGKPNVRWEKGRYGPTNTLLIDDSPYKALRNPPYTAIFPDPYNASSDIRDNDLGAEGTLRLYLKGLAAASDVQKYVKDHPFGQEAISNDHEHWHIFRRIATNVQNTNDIAVIRSKDTLLDVAAADENNPASKYRKINSDGTKEVKDIPVSNEGNVTKPHVEVNGNIKLPSVDINVNTRDQHVENSTSHSRKRKKLGFSEGFVPVGFFLRSLHRAYRKALRRRSRRY